MEVYDPSVYMHNIHYSGIDIATYIAITTIMEW